VVVALAKAMKQLDYKNVGRSNKGAQTRNTILTAAVDLEDLHAKGLVSAFCRAMGVPRKAVYRAGKRRLKNDWFKWNR